MKAEVAGRPITAASLALIAGISSASHPFNYLFLVLLIWIGCYRPATLVAVGAGFLTGLLLAPTALRPISPMKGEWSGTGVVITAPNLGSKEESCLVETDLGSYEIVARSHSDLTLGQTLRLRGVMLPLAGPLGRRLAVENVSGTVLCAADDIKILRRAPFWFESANRIRNGFVESVDSVLPGEDGALINALCFSASSPVQPGLRRNLSRTGSVHILSVSGLQVFLLAFLVQLVLSHGPIPRGLQVAVIAIFLVGYAVSTGLHPSTIRAVVMAILAMSAYLVRREPDFLSALGLAAILTVIWQPWSIYTPGFQLSYVTVAALALYWRPFSEETGSKLGDRFLGRIWFLLRASVIVTFAAAPLTAYHFGELPLVAPITNLLIAPIVPVIIGLSMVAWPLGMLVPALRIGLLKAIVSPLAGWVMAVTGLLGRQAWCSIGIPPFNAYWLLPFYGGFIILWNRGRK